jgi:hypothetical protein
LAGLVLAAGAFWTVLQLSFPEARVGFLWLLLPLAILISGIGLEWSHVPRPSWSSRLWGDNPLACYLCVTALSLPILLAILVALRDGASTRPRLSGAMAGLVASGITTALYTIHCPENSLLFVMSWHGLAVSDRHVHRGACGGTISAMVAWTGFCVQGRRDRPQDISASVT